MTPAAYRNKREPKLVRRDPPHPDATALWEPLYPALTALTKAQARHVLESLEELVADPEIDFGTAFGGARNRQDKAVRIMRDYIKNF